jgi:hypothetical protein
VLLTVLLRLALLVFAPLLVAPVATAQPSASRATASTAPTGLDCAAEVDLLRPAAWLTLHGLSHGSRMPFASPELGIDGVATVVGIGRCPESAAGSEPGKRAVTGLVRRTAQNWVTVHLVGQSEPIRATPEHPIWSKSRQCWVGAGHLEAGEELDAAGDGDEPPSGLAARAVVVERIERHASPAAVFNPEVHRAHTYRVGAGRVLVHNNDPKRDCLKGGPKSAEEMAADLSDELGTNRVSAVTAGGVQVDIDLRGKGHYDKEPGRVIETPHVHEAQTHTGPNGERNTGPKTTRPATKADVRTAQKIAGQH